MGQGRVQAQSQSIGWVMVIQRSLDEHLILGVRFVVPPIRIRIRLHGEYKDLSWHSVLLALSTTAARSFLLEDPDPGPRRP